MNKKKKIFLAVWVVVTTALFYFFQPESEMKPETSVMAPVTSDEAPLNPNQGSEELPLKLKARIDKVLASIEGMWDPTGNKVKEVGEKMETLEKALEENNPKLAEKILSEIEVIISEK